VTLVIRWYVTMPITALDYLISCVCLLHSPFPVFTSEEYLTVSWSLSSVNCFSHDCDRSFALSSPYVLTLNLLLREAMCVSILHDYNLPYSNHALREYSPIPMGYTLCSPSQNCQRAQRGGCPAIFLQPVELILILLPFGVAHSPDCE
jgi:hypothetical protein